MSLERFRQALAVMNVAANEKEWFPKWVAGYAARSDVKSQIGADGLIPVTRDLVIGFLRSLRDRQIPAWRRLQAARAIEVDQASVLRNSVVDFRPIRDTLREIAAREDRGGADLAESNLVAGEGNAGVLDEREPESIRRMRTKLRNVPPAFVCGEAVN